MTSSTGSVGMVKLWQVMHVTETFMHVLMQLLLASTLSYTARLICVSMFLAFGMCENGEICTTSKHAILFQTWQHYDLSPYQISSTLFQWFVSYCCQAES
jgi:hypothetical protein